MKFIFLILLFCLSFPVFAQNCAQTTLVFDFAGTVDDKDLSETHGWFKYCVANGKIDWKTKKQASQKDIDSFIQTDVNNAYKKLDALNSTALYKSSENKTDFIAAQALKFIRERAMKIALNMYMIMYAIIPHEGKPISTAILTDLCNKDGVSVCDANDRSVLKETYGRIAKKLSGLRKLDVLKIDHPQASSMTPLQKLTWDLNHKLDIIRQNQVQMTYDYNVLHEDASSYGSSISEYCSKADPKTKSTTICKYSGAVKDFRNSTVIKLVLKPTVLKYIDDAFTDKIRFKKESYKQQTGHADDALYGKKIEYYALEAPQLIPTKFCNGRKNSTKLKFHYPATDSAKSLENDNSFFKNDKNDNYVYLCPKQVHYLLGTVINSAKEFFQDAASPPTESILDEGSWFTLGILNKREAVEVMDKASAWGSAFLSAAENYITGSESSSEELANAAINLSSYLSASASGEYDKVHEEQLKKIQIKTLVQLAYLSEINPKIAQGLIRTKPKKYSQLFSGLSKQIKKDRNLVEKYQGILNDMITTLTNIGYVLAMSSAGPQAIITESLNTIVVAATVALSIESHKIDSLKLHKQFMRAAGLVALCMEKFPDLTKCNELEDEKKKLAAAFAQERASLAAIGAEGVSIFLAAKSIGTAAKALSNASKLGALTKGLKASHSLLTQIKNIPKLLKTHLKESIMSAKAFNTQLSGIPKAGKALITKDYYITKLAKQISSGKMGKLAKSFKNGTFKSLAEVERENLAKGFIVQSGSPSSQEDSNQFDKIKNLLNSTKAASMLNLDKILESDIQEMDNNA